MTNVGGATNTYEAQSRNMMNICTKYGFDFLLFLVVTVDTNDTRRMMDDRGRTMPKVSHKLKR